MVPGMADPLRIAPLLLFASLASFACSDDPGPHLETKTLPAVSCGPHGHILPDALPGESYRSTDPRVRSVVVSNATVTFGSPWTVTVDELRGPGAVVVQLRDADHQTVCAALEGPL
jgi:hypothetical protein